MNTPRIILATLCLNEMEWLPGLYRQHKDWPGMVRWVFVEAADVAYQKATPSLVSCDGLSVDGTTEYLHHLEKGSGGNLLHIPHGLTRHPDKAQGKCEARQRYLDVCSQIAPPPDFVIVLDADEFYTREHQYRINQLLRDIPRSFSGMVLKQRHLWYPPNLSLTKGPAHEAYPAGWKEVFSREVVGGYWDVPHCRLWRYTPGMRYINNHNTPENPSGRSMKELLRRYDKEPAAKGGIPECIHMGYASSIISRMAKHTYYTNRGEGQEGGRLGNKRLMYVECREAWERWREGEELPHGAKVIPYTGPIPEVFQVGQEKLPHE